MPQPNRMRKPSSLLFADAAEWNNSGRKPSMRSLADLDSQLPEPFVEATAAGEFLNYSPRTIKQMAREGRIPAHPFGSGDRKRWYFLISELAEHLRGQVNSAHGGAGRDKTQRRVI
jgi:Helix-turn-helix domain